MLLLDITAQNNITIQQAMRQIDTNRKRFLIIMNNDNVTINGVVSDGDIRRALLRGNSIHDSINVCIIKDYVYCNMEATFHDIVNQFKSFKIDYLPILDDKKRVINLITKKQLHILLLEDIEYDALYDFTKLDHISLEHEIYSRPWGFYKSTLLSTYAQAKIITVLPKSELSLQEHKLREEHWVIIKGKGTVVLGESIINVYPGKYIYIPKGCKHQIINDSVENILFSEVQLGDYFGEDDIIRYSDKYGRVN